jgi:vancomycin resistance protein YoaR
VLTTLFNAALRAGFQMGARRNHFYYIDRYPLGLDATVFISASGAKQTMSWTNDTQYPVLIRGYQIRAGGTGWVKFALFSVPTGRRVSFATSGPHRP